MKYSGLLIVAVVLLLSATTLLPEAGLPAAGHVLPWTIVAVLATGLSPVAGTIAAGLWGLLLESVSAAPPGLALALTLLAHAGLCAWLTSRKEAPGILTLSAASFLVVLLCSVITSVPGLLTHEREPAGTLGHLALTSAGAAVIVMVVVSVLRAGPGAKPRGEAGFH